MSKLARGLWGLLAGALFLSGRAWASDAEVLDFVRAGLHEQYTSITSCQGTVHLVMTVPRGNSDKLINVQDLTVAFDGKRLRVSNQVRAGEAASFEGLFDGTTTTELMTQPVVNASVKEGLTGMTGGMFSLFADPRRIGSYSLASAACSSEGTERLVGRETLGDSDCLVVEYAGPMMRIRLWVDPEKGYHIRKSRAWLARSPFLAPPSTLFREEEVTLRRYPGGQWGPSTYSRTEYQLDGSVEKKVYGTFSPGFRISTTLSEAAFHFVLPEGVMVLRQDQTPAPPTQE